MILARRVEVVGGVLALGGLGVGVVALGLGVWPRVATVAVVVCYVAVSWVLARGLAR